MFFTCDYPHVNRCIETIIKPDQKDCYLFVAVDVNSDVVKSFMFPVIMLANIAAEKYCAFRGRLMSFLAPARGMPALPAKGGFSRFSLFTHSGVSPRPHLEAAEKVKYSTKICGSTVASPNILRFPRASVEPPRALPSGVSPSSYFPQESTYIQDALFEYKAKFVAIFTFSATSPHLP